MIKPEEDFDGEKDGSIEAYMQRKSASLNILSHQYKLGIGVSKDLNKSLELRLEAAKLGYKEAQFVIGCGYLSGDDGLPVNYQKAIYWLTKAADQGEYMAMLHLAEAHYNMSENVQAWKWVLVASYFENIISLEEVFKMVVEDMSEMQVSESHNLANIWIDRYIPFSYTIV